jgi:signal transduction histidine kinase
MRLEENCVYSGHIETCVLPGSFLGGRAERHGVRTSLDLDPAASMIVGDRVQLQQVIVNLGINAIQAMAAASGAERRITIRTNKLPDGGVAIVVEDTGPGIPADLRDRIFDSFFTTKSAGMGIGLAICRSIVESHDGRITVSDHESRQGARFEILLPAAPHEN